MVIPQHQLRWRRVWAICMTCKHLSQRTLKDYMAYKIIKEKKNTRCDIFKRRSFFSTQFFQMLWHNVPKVTSFLTFESSTWGLTNIVSWPRTMIRLVFLTVPFLNFGFFLTKKDYVFPSDHDQLLTESRKLELEANLHVLGWHYVMLHAWSTRECGDEMIAYTTFPRALCMRSFFPGV